jgi:hypothetical protein
MASLKPLPQNATLLILTTVADTVRSCDRRCLLVLLSCTCTDFINETKFLRRSLIEGVERAAVIDRNRMCSFYQLPFL